MGRRVPPKRPAEMGPPPVPPRRWAEAARELKAEMHAVAKEASAKQAAELGADVPKPGPVKRGARPDRPSQVNREAGRSWERMAERLSDLKAELATTTAALETTCAETVELKGKMAEMETEHGQKVKMLTEQISQLEAANFQVTAAHNQLLASLPDLGHSGQYKQLFEQAEAARAELQKRLEKNTADHLQQMQVMLEEKQAAAEERRAQLVKEHVRQLKTREAEIQDKGREVTALREELLQKEATIESLQTQAHRERERGKKRREREKKGTTSENLKNSIWEVSQANEPKKKQEPKQPKVPRMIITTLYDSTTAWQAAKVVPAKPKATRMSPEEAAASIAQATCTYPFTT